MWQGPGVRAPTSKPCTFEAHAKYVAVDYNDLSGFSFTLASDGFFVCGVYRGYGEEVVGCVLVHVGSRIKTLTARRPKVITLASCVLCCTGEVRTMKQV